ncbi:MAG: delta 9 acyl-lipid fatty acid desaturase [Candidatus Binatia bacterium]|nr:MAG: delta 9 acyl-lipid fatty acid desaturase [Candidatus Binatia bacterium]
MRSSVKKAATPAVPQTHATAVPFWRVALSSLPFWGVHVACLAVVWVGWSWVALAACAATYALRVFAVTAGYHRYFSHRSFKTSRPMQFVFALLGTTSLQKGPLWWSALHRHHHRYADTEEDIHPPTVKGFWWAHVGWILSPTYEATRWNAIRDFARFPELRWLNRYHLVPAVSLAVLLFLIGWCLGKWAPGLGTSGWQLLVWGFFVSTVALWHVTFCVNSLAHVFGWRRFETRDTSRNSFWLALITFGEGWHNNHHRFPGSERQGFFWWEIDLTHYALKAMEWLGLVWDLRTPPAWVYERRGVGLEPATEGAGME